MASIHASPVNHPAGPLAVGRLGWICILVLLRGVPGFCSARFEPQGRRGRGRADDGIYIGGRVPGVLAAVGVIDGVAIGVAGFGEADVPFDPAGPDPALLARYGAPEP